MRSTDVPVEDVVFNGRTYRRYPDSIHRSVRVYFACMVTTNGKRRRHFLHRDMWEEAYGPIPPKAHIHHKDENPLHNELSNFECLTPAEHNSKQRGRLTPRRQAHLDRIRPIAAEWHASEAGHQWHKEHGQQTWQNRVQEERTCAQCSKSFLTRTNRSNERFCSNNCKAKWRKQHKLDHEQRICALCGSTFSADRFLPTRYCSRSCANKKH